MKQVISGTLSQAEAHKHGKEDNYVSSGEDMTPNKGSKARLSTANDNFTLEICCPKEKASDENDIVNDIREMMESLILNQFNQANKNKGEA